MGNDVHSLSHSKWRCKYHIVFAPKYRRQVIYKELRADIGKIIRMLCERMNVTLLEAEACPDHIHILVEIPPHMSVSRFMGTLKSKSALTRLRVRRAGKERQKRQPPLWGLPVIKRVIVRCSVPLLGATTNNRPL